LNMAAASTLVHARLIEAWIAAIEALSVRVHLGVQVIAIPIHDVVVTILVVVFGVR